MGDSHIGLQARLMSQAMRKLTGIISKSKTCLIFINQIRMKIGVMFGNPETTSGGKALKFYSSVRIDIRRIGTIKEATDAIGSRVRARVVKNKIAPPFREAEFDIMFDSGISYEGDLIDFGSEAGSIIRKSGAWFNYGDVKLGQGRENAKKYPCGKPGFVRRNKEQNSRCQRVLQVRDVVQDAKCSRQIRYEVSSTFSRARVIHLYRARHLCLSAMRPCCLPMQE